MKAKLMAICTLVLAGCNVGPKYVKPTAPAAPAYKEAAPAAYTSPYSSGGPGTWQPAQPSDALLKGKWWEVFKEPELNALEDQLNIDNQNIKQFFQNFMAARAQVSEARAGFYPTLTANPSLNKTGTGNGNTTGSYSLPLEASWAPDLWGRIRNTVREAQYAAQVSAADLENERLTEQAALAEYFFELRGQDALQDLYNRTVSADRELLALTRALVETGIDSPEAIPLAEETLHEAEATAIGIATNRAIYEHAIAMLIGKPASTFSMPVKNLSTTGSSDPLVGVSFGNCSNGVSGYRRGRTDHGSGECADWSGEGRVLSIADAHRKRRAFGGQHCEAVFFARAVLVAWCLGYPNDLRRWPAQSDCGTVHCAL